MRKLTFTTIGILSVFAVLAVASTDDNKLTKKEKRQGWKLLFDGETLDGWKATGRAEGWAVEEGALACTVKGGGYLYTVEEFENFSLSIDYKVAPGTNSGVFFRWSNLGDPVNTGIEMQVFDSHDKTEPDNHDDGAVYDILAPSKNMTKPAGEWNRAVLTCKDSLVTIALNGKKICEMDLNRWTEAHKNPDGSTNKFNLAYKDLPRKGHIGLQDHGGRVWFKNVKIKPFQVKGRQVTR